ncbi:MAG: ATP-binding protein, partial [Chitinophagales bacterium]
VKLEGLESASMWIELSKLHTAHGNAKASFACVENLLNLAKTQRSVVWEMKAKLGYALYWCNEKDFEKTHLYLDEIKVLNESIKDSSVRLDWHYLMADLLLRQHKFDLVPKHIRQLSILSPKDDFVWQAKIHKLSAFLKQHTGNYEPALSHFFKALDLLENLKTKELSHYIIITTLHINIATVYDIEGVNLKVENHDYSRSLGYLNRAEKIALKIDYQVALSHILSMKGNNHFFSGNVDAALVSYQSALQLALSCGNEYDVLCGHAQIASVYMQKEEVDLAITSFEAVLNIAIKLKHTPIIINVKSNVSKCYAHKKEYEKAIKYKQEVLVLLDKNNKTDLLEQYHSIAFLYKEIGDIEQGFHFIQKYIDLKDEMYSTEKEKSIVEMQTRYETEKKEQEAQQLRELEQVKSRFFSQITHEFRTPLTLILGPIQQLLQHPKIQSDSELQNRLTLVERNGKRLSNLVNQLLDLSKLESGKMTIQKKHGDLIAFVESIIANFQNLAQKQNIRFRFHTSIPQLAVQFDVDKLEKIFYNLLSNAFKFTPSNGEITLQLQTQNDTKTHTTLQITLQDTGKGIEAKHLPHVFDRFYQADNSNVREAEGSGVGLSLVKELIELQGGAIEVKSEINIGTIFTFNLPLELSETSSTVPILAPPLSQDSAFKTFNAPTTSPSKKKKTKAKKKGKNIVLVVEDNPDMQSYIQSILSPQYEILQAMNGEEGVNLALEEIPDLIVSDVMMPKKDGYTLCKELKANEKTNHIPIFLLTAKAALDSRIEGLEQGADVYLSKPFSPKELLLNIENQIKVRQKLQEKYSQLLQSSSNEASKESITNPFLQKLIQTIEAHLNDIELSAKLLSEYMFMSRQQIHRKLRALTNYSTTEFIRLIRLQKAEILLKTQQYTMTEIAYEVGFSTPSYFSRAFVKQYGVSPSKWLQKER